MNRENFERLVQINEDMPLDPREIATDENLALAATENQLRAERDERDPHAMTADKLAAKIPGMAHGVPYIGTPVRACYVATRTEYEFEVGYLYREDDEELLKEAQAEWASTHQT